MAGVSHSSSQQLDGLLLSDVYSHPRCMAARCYALLAKQSVRCVQVMACS
jgi:hypothetical protein